MSGPPRVRSINVPMTETELRPVLGPAGNKVISGNTPKQAMKPQRRVEKQSEIGANEKKPEALSPHCVSMPLPLSMRKQGSVRKMLRSNMSPNASCSSDASSESSHSRASTGRLSRRSVTPVRKKQGNSKLEMEVVQETLSESTIDASPEKKKRCAWVTQNSDLCYAVFHDEEWGVPVHDDRRLFELLSLSGALAELTWPAILNKRHILRDVFMDFDPFSVSKLNEKKIIGPGSPVFSLLSEPKLRAIIENAKQICKIIDEFGSFDKYIWNYVNHKPIISRFRYPRQIPVKTSKADSISKDLVKRGFRSVGPTVIYTFMQVSGLTNDHLTTCFRFNDCIAADEPEGKNVIFKPKVEEKSTENMDDDLIDSDMDLARTMEDFKLSAK